MYSNFAIYVHEYIFHSWRTLTENIQHKAVAAADENEKYTFASLAAKIAFEHNKNVWQNVMDGMAG